MKKITADKYSFVASRLASLGPNASLLDVGCRDQALARYVEPLRPQYTGVDIEQSSNGGVHHVLDVSNGLPFADRSFDMVVALDLLEHVDKWYEVMMDLVRVTRAELIITLPNLAHFAARLSFLRHGAFAFTTKYDLTFEPSGDRHRWVTVLPQTNAFMRRFAESEGFSLSSVYVADGRGKLLFARLGTVLGLPPSLWAWKVTYVLVRH